MPLTALPGRECGWCFAALQYGYQALNVIMPDEPNNNLDTNNIEILANAINGYKEMLIVALYDA